MFPNSASEEALRFSVNCVSNSGLTLLKLLTQSMHSQLLCMDSYFSSWILSFLKYWQIQVLSQENLVWVTIYAGLCEETTLDVSPRTSDIATRNKVHSPCKSTVINMGCTLSIYAWACGTEILAKHRESARKERTIFKRSVEFQSSGFTGQLSKDNVFTPCSDFMLVMSSHNS